MAAMTEAIRTAQTRVHVEFYISDLDDTTREFFAALADASARGVKVRFLFDHLGSRKLPGHKAMLEYCTTNGIEWYRMMPVRPLHGQWRRPDLRNHRKILVVDDQIAFCGSQNLVEASYGNEKYQKMGRKWVDLMARVTGTTVAALDAVFASDWYTESGEMLDVKRAEPRGPVAADAITDVTCQVVPSGRASPARTTCGCSPRCCLGVPPDLDHQPLLHPRRVAALRDHHRGPARRRRGAVRQRAVRPVHGRPRPGVVLRRAAAAGVKILMYPPPLILHGKHFSVDDTVAVIGTSNMDLRSFALNYEVCMMLLGPEAVAAAAGRSRTPTGPLCRPLTQEEWAQRPQRTRYVDTVMRLTAALQ